MTIKEIHYTHFEPTDVTTTANAGQLLYERQKTQYHKSTLSHRIEYRNHLSAHQTLTITDRLGVPIRLPPTGDSGNYVGITVIYSIPAGTLLDTANLYTDGLLIRDAEDISPAEDKIRSLMTVVKESVRGMAHRQGISGITYEFIIDYQIHYSHFRDIGRALYVGILDVVLSIANEDYYSLHPFTTTAHYHRQEEIFKHGNYKNIHSFVYQIHIVSNDRVVGDKYMNVHGKIMKVPSVTSFSQHDGVYIYYKTHCDEQEPHMEYHRLSAEVFRRYGLFDTRELALVYGDEEGVRKRELALMDHEQKEQKLLVEGYLQAQNAVQKHVVQTYQNTLEIESLKRKDFYEERSDRRKALAEDRKLNTEEQLSEIKLREALRKERFSATKSMLGLLFKIK